jgi:hypothetical protein
MSKISRELKTTRMHKERHPSADIATPSEPQSEMLADILQMAEESGRRSMQKVRPRMEKAVRSALEHESTSN